MLLSSRMFSHDNARCLDVDAIWMLVAEPLRLHVGRMLDIGGYALGSEREPLFGHGPLLF